MATQVLRIPGNAWANRRHARRRARQRYALALTSAALRAVEARIRAGGPGCVRLRLDHDHAGRALYGVKLDGLWYPVIYDHAVAVAVTFLPPWELDPYLRLVGPVAQLAPPAPAAAGPEWVVIPSTIRGLPDDPDTPEVLT
jgi:hypothetical protein